MGKIIVLFLLLSCHSAISDIKAVVVSFNHFDATYYLRGTNKFETAQGITKKIVKFLETSGTDVPIYFVLNP